MQRRGGHSSLTRCCTKIAKQTIWLMDEDHETDEESGVVDRAFCLGPGAFFLRGEPSGDEFRCANARARAGSRLISPRKQSGAICQSLPQGTWGWRSFHAVRYGFNQACGIPTVCGRRPRQATGSGRETKLSSQSRRRAKGHFPRLPLEGLIRKAEETGSG